MTFERYLMDIHSKKYSGLDDNMIDDFNDWLCDKNPDWLIMKAEDWSNNCPHNGYTIRNVCNRCGKYLNKEESDRCCSGG